MKIAAPLMIFPKGIFVAVFADGQPLTEDLDKLLPSGVMVVDPETGDQDWFLKSKDKNRAGRRGDGKRTIDVNSAGMVRPFTCWILGFGNLPIWHPMRFPRPGLWKITRE